MKKNIMDVDLIVKNYQRFLDNSWKYFSEIGVQELEGEYLKDDWCQGNWEFLVEAVLCPSPDQFLEVYGDGADCNGSSSRVWLPDALPTHRIYCFNNQNNFEIDVLSGSQIDVKSLPFGKFVSWNGKQYGEDPPFDFLLLEDESEIYVVEVKNIKFGIELFQEDTH